MAGNIEDLNFDVILDDKEFNDKIKEIEKRAEKFNISVSDSLKLQMKLDSSLLKSDLGDVKKDIRKQVSAIEKALKVNLQSKQIISSKGVQNARDILPILDEISRKIQNMPQAPLIVDPNKLDALIDKLDKFVDTGVQGADRLNSAFGKSSGLLGQLVGLAGQYFSLRGITQFVSSMVRITGELEMQRVALRNIIQDADGADKVFSQLKELAVQSPYTLQELTQYTKQLAAFSFPKEELFETNKMLADVAAGLGVSMDRIILAYGQVRAASFLRGQEVRQFTEAGIPILEELAKQFQETEGRMVSAAEVFDKISARQVPFEMVARAFKDMTSEGGKFYNMQEVLSQTLQGRIMKLKDNWQIALSNMGNSVSGTLKSSVDFAIFLAQNLETVMRFLLPVMAAFAANGIVKDIGNFYNHIKKVITAFNEGRAAGKSFAAALGTSGWALAAAGVALVATAIWQVVEATTKFRKEIEAIKREKLDNMNDQLSVLENIKERLNNATQGTQNYRDAINELNTKLGDFLPKLVTEADSLRDVAAAAAEAEAAIRAKAAASAGESIRTKLKDKYGDKLSEADERLKTQLLLGAGDLTGKDAETIIENFRKSLKAAAEGESASKIFGETVRNYIGRELPIWQVDFNSAIQGFKQQYQKFWKEEAKLTGDLDDKYGIHYPTKQIADEMAVIDEEYTKKTRDAYINLKDDQEAYNKAIKEADIDKLRKMAKVYKDLGFLAEARPLENQLEALTATPSGWKANVNNALSKLGAKGKGKGDSGLWAEANENYWDYVDSLQKGYKEASAKLKNLGKQADTEIGKQLKDEIAARKAAAKALGISLIEKGTGGGKGQSADEKAVRTRIDAIKELQRAYKDLIKDGFTEDESKGMIDLYFSWMDESARDRRDFWVALSEQADALEKYDSEGAKRLRADIARGQAHEKGDERKAQLKEEKKALEDFQKAEKELRDYLSKDFEVEGEKVAHKVSKAIADYRSVIAKIDNNTDDLINKSLDKQKKGVINKWLAENKEKYEAMGFNEQAIKLMAETYWNTYRQNQRKALKEQAEQEKKYEREKLKAKLPGLAKEALNEELKKLLEGKSYDKLSLSDLLKIKEALENLEVPDDIKKALEEDNELLKLFVELLRKAGKEEITGKIDPKKAEKYKKVIDGIVNGLGKMSGILKSVAKITGDGSFDDAAKVFESITENIEAAKTGYEFAGGASNSYAWIGAVVGGVLNIITQIGEAIGNAKEQERQLNLSLEETREHFRKLKYESNLSSGVDTLFGDDLIKKIQNATKSLDELPNKIFFQHGGLSVTTYKSFWKTERKTFRQIADEFGVEMLKGDYYNPDFLDKLIEKYGNLNDELVGGWRIMRSVAEEYNKALEQIEATVKSLFGSLASDMTDKFIDNFKQMGDAVYDLEDIFQGLGETILKSLLQSYILENVLSKYEEEAKGMMSSYARGEMTADEYAQWLSQFTSAVEQDTKNQSAAINGLISAFADHNLLQMDSDEANSVGSGIKSITEETASLLASYINAMRADLSYMRGLQERGWGSVDAIRGAIPTLNDYMQKVAANTANNAQHAEDILLELRDVIGSVDSSGRIVRVQMVS